MLKPRAILIDENPDAIVYTSRGWRYPDGTVKPFYEPKTVGIPENSRSEVEAVGQQPDP